MLKPSAPWSPQGQDAIPKIAAYLRDADTNVRLEAVKALDDIGGPKTVDALLELKPHAR